MKAQMLHYSAWVKVTDPAILKQTFDKLLKDSGFDVRQFQEEFFEPQGYTSLYLLSESHFAVHTFPEKGLTYIELSSCVAEPFKAFRNAMPKDIVDSKYCGDNTIKITQHRIENKIEDAGFKIEHANKLVKMIESNIKEANDTFDEVVAEYNNLGYFAKAFTNVPRKDRLNHLVETQTMILEETNKMINQENMLIEILETVLHELKETAY